MKKRIKHIKKLMSLIAKKNKKSKLKALKNIFTITFAGDTSLGDHYLRKYENPGLLNRLENEPLSFFDGVKPLVEGSDYFILNLETVLTEKPGIPLEGKEYPNYDNPERMVKALQYLGVTAVSLANNHTMDFGPQLMLQTKNLIENNGIKSIGAGLNAIEASKPISFKLIGSNRSKKVFILSAMRASRRYREDYNYFANKDSAGVNRLKTSQMVKQINSIRQNEPDALIIVFPHWQGFDYKQVSEKVHSICHKLIAAGADYIIGHGPHTINEIEKSGQGTIAYSIGNFVFNSPGRYSKFDTLPYSCIVKIKVYETNEGWQSKPEFYPIITDNRKTDFYVHRADVSEKLEAEQLLYGKTDDIPLTPSEYKKNEVKEIILGNKKLHEVNFNNQKVLEEHIQQLDLLQNEIDLSFRDYYKKIFRSKQLKNNTNKYLKMISSFISREHITHAHLLQFERNRINIKRAVSFRDIIVECSEVRRLGYPVYSWKLEDKTSAYKFADSINVRRPKNSLNTYKFSDIAKQDGPIVIKPSASTGSKGVYLIFNSNKIFSVRDGIWLKEWAEMTDDVFNKIAMFKNSSRPYFGKDEWTVEELIMPGKEEQLIPHDIKFYCFYGKILLVLEICRYPELKYCWWNSDGDAIKTGKYEKDLFLGEGASLVQLSLAANISKEIPAPFVRIDFLKSADGLVFGEFTPRPGRFQLFNDEWDRKLGEAYREAEARILRDLLNGNKFNAFTNLFDV